MHRAVIALVLVTLLFPAAASARERVISGVRPTAVRTTQRVRAASFKQRLGRTLARPGYRATNATESAPMAIMIPCAIWVTAATLWPRLAARTAT